MQNTTPELTKASKLGWPKLILAALIFALVGVVAVYLAMASGRTRSSVSLSMSPSSQKLTQNSDFVVTVTLDTAGKSVNAVQANISYPADKFSYVGTDSSTSSFAIQAEESQQPGSIRIARGSTSAVSGSQVVVTKLTFKPVASSRKSTISFGSGTAVVSSTTNTNILSNTISGQYSINP